MGSQRERGRYIQIAGARKACGSRRRRSRAVIAGILEIAAYDADTSDPNWIRTDAGGDRPVKRHGRSSAERLNHQTVKFQEPSIPGVELSGSP